MKIGFFDTCLNWVPHFETDLELMELELGNGNEVLWLNCNGNTSFCQPNPYHLKNVCKNCINRKKKGLNLVPKALIHNLFGEDASSQNIDVPEVKSIGELKNLMLDNFDIGLATASSLFSVLRDSNPDLVKHKPLWHRIYKSAYITYQNVTNLIVANGIEKMYIFNGRFAPERATIRACEKQNIPFIIHERGRNKNYYMLYHNVLPHNRAYFVKKMNEAWEDHAISLEEKTTVANNFFREREKGQEQFWISFVHNMKEKQLPEKWDAKKSNITILTSSEDELAAISDEWKNPVYGSQIEGITKILSDAPFNYQFYLRIHPNLMGVKNKDIDALLNLRFPNLEIIESTSSVNTYELVKKSEKVIVFGSTVGVEATYWGTPSILAGMSYYHGINATYDATSHSHILELINQKLDPKPVEGALRYGYYLKTFGYKYRNYEGSNFYLGRYKDHYLYGNAPFFLTMWLLSKLNILSPIKRFMRKHKVNLFYNKV